MTVLRLPAGDRATWLALRQQDVTASSAGALLGVHDYLTPYELWALKTGRWQEDPEETAPMQRGRLLEPVAVQLLQEKRPTWRITHNTGGAQVYLRDPDARLGATPDVFAVDPEREGTGVVQVKSVEPGVFRRKWRDPDTGDVAPPLWIAVQAIVEAHLAGASWAAVAALTVGFGADLEIVPVPIHAGVLDAVRAKVADFWAMVDEGREPAPDYARDGELIARLYADEKPDELDLTLDNRMPELVSEHAALKRQIKDATEKVSAIDAEVKQKLGNHAVALIAGGKRITWKTQSRRGYTVAPSSARVLRYPKDEEEMA